MSKYSDRAAQAGEGQALLDINEQISGYGRALVATLFDSMRPWQAFQLIQECWQQELDRLIAKGIGTLEAEVTEARLITEDAYYLSQRLRTNDEIEAAEGDERETAGEYDEIAAFLAEEAKRRPAPSKIKHLHRFSDDDARCVYCGKLLLDAATQEECQVLLAARKVFAASTGEK
jgi:hypothetical protein